MMIEVKKKGRGNNPNSRKNLKPVRPGDPGRNVLGGRSHDMQKKTWKNATADYVRDIINIVVMGQPSDLVNIYSAPEGPGAPENCKRVLAKYVHDAIAAGNWGAIEQILGRVIGKVPDRIEHVVEEKRELSEEVIKEKLKLLDGR